jgi:hypothetical protein
VGIPAELSKACGHRDPAEVLGDIYSMPHDDLKKLVRGAAGSRALAIKMQAAIAAMPYVHSKMPVKVEVPVDQLPTLKIITNSNSMQNQRLINSLGAPSHDAVAREPQTIDIKPEKE